MEGLLLFTALCDTGCRFVEVERPVAKVFACICNTLCYFFSGLVPFPSPTHPQDLLKSQTLSTKTHAENARFWRDRNWRNKIIVSGLALGLFEFVHWLPITVHRTYLFLQWFPTICQWNLFIGSYCFPPKMHALC